MQRDLAAAAERQAGRRDDDRNVGVAQRHRRLLERADHQVELVPVLLLRLEQDQHQVGAGGEVRRLVADDERGEVLRRLAARRPAASGWCRRRWRSSSSGTRRAARRRRGRRGSRRRSSSRRASDPSPHRRICRSGAAGGTAVAKRLRPLRALRAGCRRPMASSSGRVASDSITRRGRWRQQSRTVPAPSRSPTASRDRRRRCE